MKDFLDDDSDDDDFGDGDSGDDDFSSLGDDEVLERLGRRDESPGDLGDANNALREFRGRGYEEYVIRVGRVMCGYVVAPGDVCELVPSVFLCVERQANTFRFPRNVMERELRHLIFKWLDHIVCRTLLESLDEAALMAQIARACEGEKLLSIANKAMGELRSRYEEDLRKFCLYRVRGMFDAGMADDLLSATFDRVWERAETYDAKGKKGREELEPLTLGWLKAIARNLYFDEVRRCGRTVHFNRVEELDALMWHLRAWTDFVPDSCDERGEPEDGREAKVPHLDCMRQSMTEALTPRERDILLEERETFFTKKERRAALGALETAYGITHQNRRKISSRARVKLEDHMAAHCEECRRRIYLRRLRDLDERERKKTQKARGVKKTVSKRACKKRRTTKRKPGGNARASKKRAEGPEA